jgi:uncharacterized paraquat-inducible protein A
MHFRQFLKPPFNGGFNFERLNFDIKTKYVKIRFKNKGGFMTTCEKCGEEFKPYWRLAEVQDKRCEKCEYLENERKDKRIWTALLKAAVGFLLIIFTPSSSTWPLKVLGFFLIALGLIKLIEDALMHRRSKEGGLRMTSQRP